MIGDVQQRGKCRRKGRNVHSFSRPTSRRGRVNDRKAGRTVVGIIIGMTPQSQLPQRIIGPAQVLRIRHGRQPHAPRAGTHGQSASQRFCCKAIVIETGNGGRFQCTVHGMLMDVSEVGQLADKPIGKFVARAVFVVVSAEDVNTHVDLVVVRNNLIRLMMLGMLLKNGGETVVVMRSIEVCECTEGHGRVTGGMECQNVAGGGPIRDEDIALEGHGVSHFALGDIDEAGSRSTCGCLGGHVGIRRC